MFNNYNKSETLERRKDKILSSFLTIVDELEIIEKKGVEEIKKKEEEKDEILSEISKLNTLNEGIQKIKENFKKLLL